VPTLQKPSAFHCPDQRPDLWSLYGWSLYFMEHAMTQPETCEISQTAAQQQKEQHRADAPGAAPA
jgi:hypothetical protein